MIDRKNLLGRDSILRKNTADVVAQAAGTVGPLDGAQLDPLCVQDGGRYLGDAEFLRHGGILICIDFDDLYRPLLALCKILQLLAHARAVRTPRRGKAKQQTAAAHPRHLSHILALVLAV